MKKIIENIIDSVVRKYCESPVEQAIKGMFQFIGTPYIYGGNNPMSGFDCSGGACIYLKSLNLLRYNEDLNASQLYARYDRSDKPVRGGLVFWKNEAGTISHVGIVLNEKQYMSSEGGDSNTKTIQDAIIKNAYFRISYISYRKGEALYSNPLLKLEV